jgi:hypothetical protein
MKAKRQIESSLNSVTMWDGTGGHVRPKHRWPPAHASTARMSCATFEVLTIQREILAQRSMTCPAESLQAWHREAKQNQQRAITALADHKAMH